MLPGQEQIAPWFNALHWAFIPQASKQASLHLKLKQACDEEHSLSFSHSPRKK